MRSQLHYLYDPLCGWCYGAAPLLRAVTERLPALAVVLHGGGLFSQQPVTPAMLTHIHSHDARIAQLSGQPFGDAYRHGLLQADDLLLDSATVIRAVMAVEALDPDASLAMLDAVQRAHYQRGLRVVESVELIELAAELGLSRHAFAQAYAALSEAEIRQHIQATRLLLTQSGAQGFPTFVLQQQGILSPLPHDDDYARPRRFAERLAERLAG